MPKNYNDFLKTFDYKELSEKIFNDINSKNINEDSTLIMYKAIPEINIKMLEKYHNWLNS